MECRQLVGRQPQECSLQLDVAHGSDPPGSEHSWRPLVRTRFPEEPYFLCAPAGILSYCHKKVPFGKVETINGNIRVMLRRGRGYRADEYLLVKVQKATASRRLCQTA